MDFRDISGLLQIVIVPDELDDESKTKIDELRNEYCLEITGIVNKRGEKQINESNEDDNLFTLNVTVQNE